VSSNKHEMMFWSADMAVCEANLDNSYQ